MWKYILFVLVIPNLNFAQEVITIVDIKEFQKSNAYYLTSANSEISASDYARSDIKNGHYYLIVPGGGTPTIYSGDFEFKSTFKIDFVNFGCKITDKKKIAAYNFIVFDYLMKEYKMKWLEKIRKDVIGLNEWKINNGY